jgi:hypothetical protein
MPSIFIWKSEKPNTSNKFIKYYSGSNWALEDNENYSKSYMYLEQIVISGFNDSVITFNVKKMPQDWVGSDLLEVTTLPYQYIKSDNYGTLEHIGDWMRFTLKQEIDYTIQNLEKEFNTIQNWIASPRQPNTRIQENRVPQQKPLNTKFNQTKHNIYNKHTSPNTNHNRNTNTNIKYNSSDVLNKNKIQNDFNKFLSQYNMNLLPNMMKVTVV